MALFDLRVVRAELEESRSLGFLGPGPVDDHLEHARAFAAVVGREAASRIVDLGSGGGLPALVLAAVSDASLVLVDRSTQRCAFLTESIDRLGLAGRVAVVEADAESLARSSQYDTWADVVTARSFGPPAVTAEAGCRFLRAAGRLIVSEPPDDTAGDRWHDDRLAQLGLRYEGLVREGGAGFAILRRDDAGIDARYPRRSATVRKRPLF